MNSTSPVISVITVVYNGANLLEDTIQSVLCQTYPFIEFIVIDGNSIDGTIEIIKKYSPQIDHWISEKDKGIYDAMNKGLGLATGNFVFFLNCGDHFYTEHTAAQIMSQCTPETDVLFGEVMMVDNNRKAIGTRSEITTQKIPERLNWKSMQKGQVVSHQGFMVRKELSGQFWTENLCADIDWMINALKKSEITQNTKLIFVSYLVGGISKQQHKQSMKDRFLVLNKHYGTLPNLFNHFLIVLRAIWFRITRIGKRSY